MRLKQGDYAQQTDLRERSARAGRSATPMPARAGCIWSIWTARVPGSLDNLAVIAAIAGDGMASRPAAACASEADLQRLFDAGVQRVVLGSVAIRDPELVAGWLRRPTAPSA